MKARTLLYGFVFGATTVLLAGQVTSLGSGGSGISDEDLREAMKQYANVGKGHRNLKNVKPRNAQKIKWWSAADSAPRESESRSEGDWILDSRFLTQTIKGDWLGISFEAYAILGYDNATEEYQLVWMTDRSTRMVFSHGKCDSSGQVITLHGEYYDPIAEKTRQIKTVLKILDKKGNMLFTLFDVTLPDEEFKVLEVESTKWVARGA